MTSRSPLTANQLEFIDRYLAQVKPDAGEAYQAVFKCSAANASGCASRMLGRKAVKAEIAARRKARNAKADLSGADLLKELQAVIEADPRELMEFRRGACRFCYGFNFEYHRTPNEYRVAMAEYKAAVGTDDPLGLAFDMQGGVGFDPNKKPHKACPECHGNGTGYSFIKDSRTVSKAAARLFVGIKETANGVEIKTRAADNSVRLYMHHLGMLEPDRDAGKASAAEKAAEIAALLQQAGATVGRPTK